MADPRHGPPNEAGTAELCPDCGRPKAPIDQCDPGSIDDDGECPYLTITRLRARVAELEAGRWRAWEADYERGYDDSQKTDCGRADVIRSEKPHKRPDAGPMTGEKT